MKTILPFICFFLFVSPFFTQTNLNGSHSAVLDVNHLKVRCSSSNIAWSDYDNKGYSIFHNGTDKQMIYANYFTVCGVSSVSNTVYSSTSSYIKNHFYPGPLSVFGSNEQLNYDKVWKLNRWEVEQFIQNQGNANYSIPSSILEYLAQNANQTEDLFPYRDVDNDGVYVPSNGDYPEFNIDGTIHCDSSKLYGDQVLLWIVNDGPASFGGENVGVELLFQQFAFIGGESLMNTSFINCEMRNKSGRDYSEFYITFFTDADIGFADNDVVESDVMRGMGITYNGSIYDFGWANAIGYYPPAIGFDFVKGPKAIVGDGVDNNRNGIIDEIDERTAATSFLYSLRPDLAPVNIQGSPGGNVAIRYQIAQGLSPNGNSYVINDTVNNSMVSTTFMCPSLSDTLYWYCTAGINPHKDDKVTQAKDYSMVNNLSGFEMNNAAVKEFILAIPAAISEDTITPFASMLKLKFTDDTIQSIVDNCFDLGCQPIVEDFSFTEQNDSIYRFVDLQSGLTNHFWSFGDGTTSTDVYPTHIYTSAGDFQVCLSVDNVCHSATFCKTIHVSEDLLHLPTVDISRLEGIGNGGNELRIKYSELLTMFNADSGRVYPTMYEGDYAPIKVEIIDVSNVTPGNYELKFDGVQSNSNWKMYAVGTTDTVYSVSDISTNNRQVIPQWGVAVTVKYKEYDYNNPIFDEVNSRLDIPAPFHNWLEGIENEDLPNEKNWQKSGVNWSAINSPLSYYDDNTSDPNEYTEHLFGGSFAPFLQVREGVGQVLSSFVGNSQNTPGNKVNHTPSIQLIYTPDQTKWTRCVVLEMCPNSALSQYGDEHLHLRSGASLDKNGQPDGTGTGRSWFPGYAIDLETGERMNIAFGESSDLPNDNGADMKFNPSSRMYDVGGVTSYFGGKHMVFIFRSARNGLLTSNPQYLKHQPYYDEADWMYSKLSNVQSQFVLRRLWASCSWIHYPIHRAGTPFLANELKYSLNAKRQYQNYTLNLDTIRNNGNPYYGFELYTNIGIKEQEQLIHKIYPNPTKGRFTLSISEAINTNLELMIFDIAGKVIQVESVVSSRVQIDLKNVNKGVYFYYLYSEGGQHFAKGKIVVQ